MPYQEVEHTADWALHVWAPSLAELFEDAARGMFHLAGAAPAVARSTAGARRSIELSAGDAESLLVAWLQELLYLNEMEGVIFDRLNIESLAPTRLKATVWTRPAGRPEKAIKAVTYHNLAIRQADSGYSVNLVFDV